MRNSILTFILAILLMIPPVAYARNYDVVFNNDNVVSALNILKKETGYDFVYRKELMDGIKNPINGNFRNASLEAILDNVIAGQMGLCYEIIDNTIIICKSNASNQILTVTGKITDENGKPVIGANVILTGSKISVSTDRNGKFSLCDIPACGTIQVAYSGYRPATVKVNGRKLINLSLVPDKKTP